jgi:hypothetical protein
MLFLIKNQMRDMICPIFTNTTKIFQKKYYGHTCFYTCDLIFIKLTKYTYSLNSKCKSFRTKTPVSNMTL